MKKLLMIAAAGIFALTSCNKAPELSMEASTTTAKVGETITFTNSTEKGFNYVWDFGDGTSSEAYAPTHVYGEEGTYTVTLSGSDRKGRNFGTATTTITVEGYDDEADQAWNDIDEEEEEFMLSLVGTYSVATYKRTDNDCDNEEEATHRTASNNNATKHEVELRADGDVIITDHLGNVTTGYWSVTKDMYLSGNLGMIPVSVDFGGSSSMNQMESVVSGLMSATLSGSTLTLERTREYETVDNNFDTCYATETFKVTLTKK